MVANIINTLQTRFGRPKHIPTQCWAKSNNFRHPRIRWSLSSNAIWAYGLFTRRWKLANSRTI